MIKRIITPESTQIQLEIPEEYVGKEIEITILAVDESDPNNNAGSDSDNSDLAAKIIQEELRKERESGFDRSGPRKIF